MYCIRGVKYSSLSKITFTHPYTYILTRFDILLEDTEKCQTGNLETFVLFLFKQTQNVFNQYLLRALLHSPAVLLNCFTSRPRFHMDIWCQNILKNQPLKCNNITMNCTQNM